MNVIITEAAWTDLFHIGSTIAKDNKRRATSFVEELYDRCNELHDMARAYPLLPEREHTGIRRRVYGRYLIFYRIEEDAVQILHVLHGAMDYESVLFPEE